MAVVLNGELTESGRGSTGIELPWRVLSLLNVFRLLLPMLLLLVFFFNAPNKTIGNHQPGLFIGIAVAYFAFALLCIQTLQSRTPSAEWQAIVQLIVDAIAIGMLIHSSGGVSSGLDDAAGPADRRHRHHPLAALCAARHVAGHPGAADGNDDLVPAGR